MLRQRREKKEERKEKKEERKEKKEERRGKREAIGCLFLLLSSFFSLSSPHLPPSASCLPYVKIDNIPCCRTVSRVRR
jgi:hypothetical protein